MTENSAAPTRAYRVTIDFPSGDQCFASEQYDIRAEDAAEAIRLALIRLADSICHDPRVADLGCYVYLAPVTDGDDPDTDSSCPATARKPVCPRCGRDQIVREATARWEPDERCWSLSGAFDNEICNICGAEGDDLADWIAVTSMLPASGDLSDVASARPNAGLGADDSTADHRPVDISSVHTIDATAYRLAIASLPPDRRAIFELHQVEDFPYIEIAERIGTSVAHVEQEIAAALTHLATRLRGDLDRPA